MLLFTRRGGDAIDIGFDIKVHIIEIRGGQAKIGVEAPRNILVDRSEIRMRKIADGELRVPPGSRTDPKTP